MRRHYIFIYCFSLLLPFKSFCQKEPNNEYFKSVEELSKIQAKPDDQLYSEYKSLFEILKKYVNVNSDTSVINTSLIEIEIRSKTNAFNDLFDRMSTAVELKYTMLDDAEKNLIDQSIKDENEIKKIGTELRQLKDLQDSQMNLITLYNNAIRLNEGIEKLSSQDSVQLALLKTEESKKTLKADLIQERQLIYLRYMENSVFEGIKNKNQSALALEQLKRLRDEFAKKYRSDSLDLISTKASFEDKKEGLVLWKEEKKEEVKKLRNELQTSSSISLADSEIVTNSFTVTKPVYSNESEISGYQNNQSTTSKLIVKVDEGDLIDGTATFLASRFKQELKLQFLEKMRSDFLDPNNYFSKMLPESALFFERYQSFDLDQFFPFLRIAFINDIKNLTFKWPDLLRLKEGQNTSELKSTVFLMSSFLERVAKGETIFELIEDPIKLGITSNSEMNILLTYLSVISESFLDKTTAESTWIKGEDWNLFLKDTDKSKYFEGLVVLSMDKELQRLKPFEIENFDKHSPSAFFTSAVSFKVLSNRILNLFIVLDESLEIIRKKNKSDNPATETDRSIYYQSAFQLLEFIVDNYLTYQNQIVSKDDQNDLARSVIPLFKSNYFASKNGDYLILANNTISFLKEYVQEGKENFLDKELLSIAKNLNFIVSIVDARSSEDIARVIESASLPPGSFGIKRKSKFSVDLNAYVGLLGGREKPFGTSAANVDKTWKTNFGFTAPIGITFSWGISRGNYLTEEKNKLKLKKQREGHSFDKQIDRRKFILLGEKMEYSKSKFMRGTSLSVMISVLDLGAPVLYKISNEGDPLPEDVSFKQIFSPGLFVLYGLRNTPMTLYGGAQITPSLRKFDDNQPPVNVQRFNIGVLVDIPLVNFYSNRR